MKLSFITTSALLAILLPACGQATNNAAPPVQTPAPTVVSTTVVSTPAPALTPAPEVAAHGVATPPVAKAPAAPVATVAVAKAETTQTQSAPASPSTPVVEKQAALTVDYSEGEIRKLDMETGAVTLRHGPIKNLDMPGMTMVFKAKDKAMLSTLKSGDKVRFKATNEEGKFWVTEIQVTQ
jgi:Cu/Ag efflux protein CusF